MKIRGRIISLLTAAAMIMAMAPQITVFADTGAFTVTTTVNDGYSYESNLLTISKSGTYTISQTSNTATTDTIKIAPTDGAVTINLAGVNISSSSAAPIEIDSTYAVTINLSGTNTLDASEASGKAGLQKTSTSNTLTITSANGDGSADGSLTAKGGVEGAGIGGGSDGNGNNITISGGTIEATGGNQGAGIGGGYGGNGSNITISGGKVEANSGDSAAGIGGGCGKYTEDYDESSGTTIISYKNGNGNNIKITGGDVTANGRSIVSTDGGAGIGSGYGGSASDISIGGGTVTATGGNLSAGIGGGAYCSAENITISGGTINATRKYGAGIGGGSDQVGTNIEISGGYIIATSNNGSSIGSGHGASEASSVKITGGYFADNYIDEQTTVYGITPASGYSVCANDEESTKTNYPARVREDVKVTYYQPSDVTGTAPDTTSHSYGSTVNVSTSTPYTKDSYEQVGWTLTQGSTTKVESFTITADTTLYPVFARTFTESDEDTSITLTYGEQITDIDLEDYLKFVDNSTFSSTDGEFTFALADGNSLPAGLSLSNDGTISGTPTAAMEATDVSFTVTDGNPYVMMASLDPNPAAETATLTLTFTVNKAASTVTAVPEAISNLTYTGSEQTLVTAGTTSDGQIQYSLEESGTYSTEIPTGTNARDYTVYYKVVGDENHKDTDPVGITVSIAKAASSVTTAPTAIEGLKYTGSTQALVTAGEADGETMYYSTDNSTWSADIPTETKAGTYTVYYKVVGDDNHEDAVGGSISVTISKASSSKSSGSSYSLTEVTSSEEDITEDYIIGGDGSTTTMLFTDVDSTNQYSEAIDYVVSNGLMAGTSSTTFEPEAALTRGMIVTILHRLKGEPDSDADHGFHDVHDSAWYSEAVAWAAEVGIASGYGDGSFGPENAITREQLVAILYRYAEYKGYDVSAMAGLGGYTDSHEVGDWAVAAMEWANANGLLDVKGFSSIEPKSEASRGETASTLMTFVENITK